MRGGGVKGKIWDKETPEQGGGMQQTAVGGKCSTNE